MANAISIYGSVTTRRTRKVTYCRKVKKWVPKRKQFRNTRKNKEHWYKRRVKTCVTRRVYYQTKAQDARFTFYGEATTVFKADRLVKELGLVPRRIFRDRFRDQIDAEKFIYDKKYRKRVAEEGTWVDQDEKESP